jgi:phosphate transport system substrate-binding protein
MFKIAFMRRMKYLFCVLFSMLLLSACDNGSEVKTTDTLSSGEVTIAVDETYQPLIEQAVKVFESSYPDAKLHVSYKPESEVIKDYLEGKAKLILVTRPLTKEEEAYCEQRKIVPSRLELAKDAIAIVLNKNAKDTAFSLTQLKGILTGENTKDPKTVVFDRQGSSTVRFIRDSLLAGLKMRSDIFAANGNTAVIDYVSKNENAIGFVGLSYVSDKMDSTSEAFNTYVKVGALLNDSMGRFYQPYQAFIALKRYPLSRKLMYIKNETYPGLASGFANFLASERGQLIMAHERLFPLRMTIVIRDAAINQ